LPRYSNYKAWGRERETGWVICLSGSDERVIDCQY